MAVLEKLYPLEVEVIRSGRSFLDLIRENPKTGFELTRQWLQVCLETGAQALPASLKPPGLHWQRNLAITKEYILTDDTTTLTRVGMAYEINKERVRQIIASTISKLWSNSPEEIQRLLSLDQIALSKPLSTSLQYLLDSSLKQGGRNAIVARLLAEGKSLEELKQAAGSTRNLAKARMVLRGWGLQVPRSKRDRRRLYLQLEQAAAGHKISQGLINEVDRSVYELDLEEKGESGKRVLVSLRSLARECGLH